MDESDNYALKGGPETLSEEDQEQVYVRYRCYQSEEDLTSRISLSRRCRI